MCVCLFTYPLRIDQFTMYYFQTGWRGLRMDGFANAVSENFTIKKLLVRSVMHYGITTIK